MTAAPFLGDLARRGVEVAREGDRLRVRGPATATDMDRLRHHKREIVALLRATEDCGLPHVLLHRLSVDDLAACADLDHPTLSGYLRLLDRGSRMDCGEIPPGFTAARYCQGCGPVWLWPGAPERVVACPWCRRRKDGRAIPRP